MKSRTANRLITLGGPGSGPRPHGGDAEVATDKANKYSRIANEGTVPAQHETAMLENKMAINAHITAANNADVTGNHDVAQNHRIMAVQHGVNASYHGRLSQLPPNHNLPTNIMRGYMAGESYKKVE